MMSAPVEPLTVVEVLGGMIGLQGSLMDPAVRLLLLVVAGALGAAWLAIAALGAAGRLGPGLKRELIQRTAAWTVMAPLVAGPVLLGKLPTIALVTALSILCYREFARATGLFREKLLSLLVIVGIAAFNFAALDHWFGLWQALAPLSLVALAVAGIVRDQPKGYLQRVGLSVFALLLFGLCLSHLSYLSNEPSYRAPMLLLFIAIAANDVFAFCVGKLVGGPKLAPNTSPGKTISGAVGAVVLTTLLAYVLGDRVFQNDLRPANHLLVMGGLVAMAGILGDLTVSSVKRDVGVKDMGAIIPGHGGVLDRCNSLLLAAPIVFHYVAYFHGIGLTEPTRVLTGLLERGVP